MESAPRAHGNIKRYGMCVNDQCENYQKTIEVSHGDFVCPKCKKSLSPCPPPPPPPPTKKIVIAAVAALVLIGGGLFFFLGGSNDKQPVEDVIEVPLDSIETAVPDTVVKTDTVVVRDTVVKTQVVTVSEKPKTKPVASGSVNLGYAKFTGPVKNGKPNGMGTMRFTSSHIIDSRDSKGRVADAGDYVTGEWKDGKLVQGRWFGSDGNVKGSLMIGM